MHTRSRPPLNAVRVFTVAARHGSIALASMELGVTAGAVSHQIKKLEAELGTRLFLRSSNAIELTEHGRRFYDDSSVAIAMIDRAAETLLRDANEIVIRVSMSIAVRWLIPALEGFRRHYPAARVRVETVHLAKVTLRSFADMAISYHRAGAPDPVGELLAGDLSRPVLSPALLGTANYRTQADIPKLPAIKCSDQNWDWKLWARTLSIPQEDIRIAHEFDTDDAAIHAAVAGLGMALAPALMTRRELRAGTLVELPGFKPVELGSYRLLLRADPGRMVRNFCNWLRDEVSTITHV